MINISGTSFEPILKRLSTSEAVVNHFIKKIQEGRLVPGEKLPCERLLQQELNISRFSLREGLARLRALGIIEVIQGKGAYVAKEMSSTSFTNIFVPFMSAKSACLYEDFMEVRLAIEERSAFLAARRRSGDDLVVLEDILQKAENFFDDPLKFGELDFIFHQKIAQISGNVLFNKILDVINNHLRSFLYDHARNEASRRSAAKSHWVVFECIKNREPEKAAKTIKGHIVSCKRNLEKQRPARKARNKKK